MPSGEFVEIDIADNEVAMLDASACALAAPSPSSTFEARGHVEVNQSQEDNVDAEEEVGCVEDSHHPPVVPQVSPIPAKKTCVMTPRLSQRASGSTAASKLSMGKGGKSPAKKLNGISGYDGPATPPTGARPFSSTVPVATPGEDSARKSKKAAALTKPSKTLHSFFAKADPSKKAAATKLIVMTKTSSAKAESKSVTVAIGKKGTSKQSPPCRGLSAKVVADLGTDSNNKDKEKAATGKASGKNAGNGSKAVVSNSSKEAAKKSDKNPVNATPPDGKRSSVTSTAPGDDPELLDDSPTYAVAVASRTMSAGGRRRNGGGRKTTDKVEVAAADNDGEVVLAVPAPDETATEKPDKKRKDFSVEGGEENNFPTLPAGPVEQDADKMDVRECQVVDELTSADKSHAFAPDDTADVSCKEGKASESRAEAPKSGKGNDIEDGDATVGVEEAATEKSSVPNDACTKQFLDVMTDIDLPQSNDLMEKQEEPLENDGIAAIVEVTNRNDLVEFHAEDNAEEALIAAFNDEVKAVDVLQEATSDLTKPKKEAKHPQKQVKKPVTAAAGKANKSSKKKLASAVASEMKVNGMENIASSLKRLAPNCLAKKKNKFSVQAAKKQEVPSTLITAIATTAAAAEEMSEAALLSSKATIINQPHKENTRSNAAIASVTTSSMNLSEENASRVRHFIALREKYIMRAKELGERPFADDFEEESLSLENCAAGVAEDGLATLEKGSVEVSVDGGFPDGLLMHMLMLVQGRSLPLSSLAKQALDKFSPYITDTRPLTVESISSKIKLLAQRKSYLNGQPPAAWSEKPTAFSKLDCFENDEECYMWRWELSSIDLLPQKEAMKVKKARALRKKLQGHHRAIINLIAAVDKALIWLQGGAAPIIVAAEKLIANVSDMEEKALKFEREHEKARLLKEAKLRKQKSKASEQAKKQKEKERQEEEKRSEKKRKEEEKVQKKIEAAKEREEAKRRKNEEKEQEKLKKKRELEERENKRKARMMAFFSKGSATKKHKADMCGSTLLKDVTSKRISTFDDAAFRKLIDSQAGHVSANTFAKLFTRSKDSWRRKTNRVSVSVFVTVVSENAFAPQPYDEERVITVPNRYKFLGFHEDVRPPYRGTWSKTSDIVTGRRPFCKDNKYLDYDNDSEEEWEEGDDEEGEDLKEEEDGADEEDDLQNEEDNDGWLAAEDDLGLEEEDDETRELRKKNLLCGACGASAVEPNHFKACVVAPYFGGLPNEGSEGEHAECVTEGFPTPRDALDALVSHVGCAITPDVNISLDAFPIYDEASQAGKKDGGTSGISSQNKEMSRESQRVMAVFVHNSTQFKSKENLVTELLKAHPDITSSRAKAMRELDVIAEKRRLANGGGVVWEVKAAHLKNLGLNEMDLKISPKESPPPKSSDGADKTKEKDPNAPKRNISAYILYSNASRSDVKAENPDAGFGDVAQILSRNFKALTSEERVTWDKKAAADKERYHKEMTEYSDKMKISMASDEELVTVATGAVAPSKQTTAGSQQVMKPSTKKRKKKGVSIGMVGLFASYLRKSKKQKTT